MRVPAPFEMDNWLTEHYNFASTRIFGNEVVATNTELEGVEQIADDTEIRPHTGTSSFVSADSDTLFRELPVRLAQPSCEAQPALHQRHGIAAASELTVNTSSVIRFVQQQNHHHGGHDQRQT